MTAFASFLSEVKLCTAGEEALRWDIAPTPASELATRLEKSKGKTPQKLIHEGVNELDTLISLINSFDSEPSGPYYIGATLIRCDSFLDDNGIIGEPLNLVHELMRSIDEETSNFIGGVAPYVPLVKLNALKRALKELRTDLDSQLVEEASVDA